jgi:hypothetical protein
MIEPRSPTSWDVPDWHPDFGDAKAECEHLRELAAAVLSTIPRSAVELIVPEPGLMFLQIVTPDGIAAEAYSLGDTKGTKNRRYGLFLSPGTPREQEFYANSVRQAIGILQEGLHADSEASATAVKRKKKGTKPRGTSKKTGT